MVSSLKRGSEFKASVAKLYPNFPLLHSSGIFLLEISETLD